jgi:HEAT repeat protein
MHRWFIGLLGICGTMIVPGLVCAQNEPPADDAAVAQADPVVEPSPLLEEPKKPTALFDAVVLMIDLERPNLAMRYMKALLALDPSDADILKMRDKHGPAVFLSLGNDKRMQPGGKKLLDRMNAAFRKFAFDPTRIDSLIMKLTGSSSDRAIAILQLQSTGSVAIPRMLQLVGSTNDDNLREQIVYAMTRMGKAILPALEGALETTNVAIKTTTIETMGFVGDESSVPHLWYAAFGDSQVSSVKQSARQALARILRGNQIKVSEVSSFGAVKQLHEIARSHFRGEHRWKLNDANLVDLWSWDSNKNIVAKWEVVPETASLIVGSRFAKQALNLSPDRKDLQAMYLGMRLAFDSHVAGWDKPLPKGPGTAHNLALLVGPDIAAETLSQSLKNPNPRAALAALGVLAQIGSRSQLTSRGGQASPILASLSYPDFRVQFAAASVVLQLDPNKSFKGSTQVVAILMRALNDGGVKAGLVIDPNSDRAASFAGYLGESGYEPKFATTGQKGFEIAATRGDVEFIAIHAACIRWGLGQTIANLRADARTAGIPIVIYGPESIYPKIEYLFTAYPLIGFATNGEKSFKNGVKLFLQQRQTPPESDEQRNERIEIAGYWFAHLASGRRTGIFNITRAEDVLAQAIELPQVGENAIIALGAIATNSAQHRLQEVAVNTTRAPELRQAAALQLAFHIQRHGVLLSQAQALEVETRWQEEADPQLRTSLASVVGTFKPKSKRITDLLNSLPDAAIPAGN